MAVGKQKSLGSKIWYFIWEDNSIWSWIVNIVLAFVLIKFIVYPGLGLFFATSHPVVAVVSNSMEHDQSFDPWWDRHKAWYIENGINRSLFESFDLKNGFNKGDIMFLSGVSADEVEIGDVIVFISHPKYPRTDPIIHRVVKIEETEDARTFQTRGDNNVGQINTCEQGIGCINELAITEEQVIGKATIKIPYLGWIKIGFVSLLESVGVL